ncbi:MAG TPA: hypothetical protein VIW95_06690 [Candidatus Binatus sp.]|uniref:rolling circle replication-associated protein n=1 Tax=Candidatus Binatus sp. TaxID=2811406 RepID=UPI002F3E7901
MAFQARDYAPAPPAALPTLPCVVGFVTSQSTGERRAIGCGSWACPDCGPKKVWKWRNRISYTWRYFITLTIANDGCDDGAPTIANVMRINQAWGKFRRWLRAHCDLREYAWVNELGERTERLHKHVVIDSGYLDYTAGSRFRKAIERAGLGPWVRVERVRSQAGSAHYLTKYLSKGLGNRRWPRYARRAQTTRPAPKPADKWLFEPAVLRYPALATDVNGERESVEYWDRINRALRENREPDWWWRPRPKAEPMLSQETGSIERVAEQLDFALDAAAVDSG